MFRERLINEELRTGGSQKPVLDQAMSQILIRKEVLRFVTSLSGSVAAKAAEQGLLK